MIIEIAKQLKDDEIAQLDRYFYQETELDAAYAKAQELLANRKNGIPHDKKYVEPDAKKLKQMTTRMNRREQENIFKATGELLK